MAPSDEQTYIMVRFASWFGGVVSVPLAWADLARLPTVPAHPQIKPDGVQRGLIAEVISRFEKRGYQLKGAAPRQAESQIWQD
jgi:Nucleoside diphosphate kinase